MAKGMGGLYLMVIINLSILNGYYGYYITSMKARTCWHMYVGEGLRRSFAMPNPFVLTNKICVYQV